MRLKVMVLLASMCCCSASVNAQMAAAPAIAPGTVVEPAKALDDLLKMFEEEVIGVAKAMPADKYNFAPSAKIFAVGSPAKFDTVRTFGQEVTHIAAGNYYFYGGVSGLKPDMDMAAIEEKTKNPNVSKEDALKLLMSSFVYAHKAIATITAANAFLAIKPIDGQYTRASLAAFGVAHGFDHYGQMVEYLRMNGIVPPGSK